MLPKDRRCFSEQFDFWFVQFESFMIYLNSNLIFQSCRKYCTGRPPNRPRPGHRPGGGPRGPVSVPAQAGRQAGAVPEASGLLAGPVRLLGRAPHRSNRPVGRFRPVPRPGCTGHTAMTTAGKIGGDGDQNSGECKGKRGRKKPTAEMNSPWTKVAVGEARDGGNAGEKAGGGHAAGTGWSWTISSIRATPARFFATGGGGRGGEAGGCLRSTRGGSGRP